MRRILRYGVAAALLWCALGMSADTRFLTLHRSGVPTDQMGPAGISVADVTGDGLADIVSCAAGVPVVISKKGSDYATVWYGPNIGCTAIAVGDRDADGKPELFAGTSPENGTRAKVYIFDPTGPVKPLASVTLPTGAVESINGIAAGDVDSDGHVEVVAVTNSNAYVFGRTLLLEWDAAGLGGRDVRIGNIDDDGRTEIVLNGPIGRVLDAYAQAQEWGYAGGFGYRMHIGNLDADPELEIVWIDDQTVMILNGDDFSTTSFEKGSYYSSSNLTLGDLSGDGKLEIITEVSSSMTGFDPTGATVWSFYNHPHYGPAGMTTGDVDGDGTNELLWTTGLNDSGSDSLHIASKTGLETTLVDLDGYFSTVVADLDGDGNRELIAGSFSTESGYYGGLVQVLDYRTKAVKATLQLQNDTQFYWGVNVWQIEVGQLDNDPALEILILGAKPYDGQLHVFDGVTYARQWTSTPYSPTYLAKTVVVTNMDGDPVDEIVVGMSDNSVHILNGASPIVQWTSPLLGSTIWDLDVADVDDDGKKDIVVGTGNAVHVLTPATGSARKVTLSQSAALVAATRGRFAVLDGDQWGNSGNYTTHVRSFKGSDLSQEFACQLSTTTNYLSNRALAFGPIGGVERLLVGQEGTLFILPLGGTSCPAMEQVNLGRDIIYRMHFAELTGDAHPEMLLESIFSWEILSIGTTAEPAGDANRDGLVTDVDIDTLVHWLLADGSGIPPTADVNGDGCIDASDVFYLINYRRGTGPAPVP
ncbi:MAG TPA: FG-GAP-like repeat-containing protein [Thermoanaerobaculia bacterium]|jgi:hypothetical protein